jgi:hypothetical protein
MPQVNTLGIALARRSEEAQAASTAHKAALGALALARALEEGAPLKPELGVGPRLGSGGDAQHA